MQAKKLLLITYYWPPSGGAGVQRWLKLTDYLTQLGWQIFVVTVDENSASYPVVDESLNHEVNPNVKVYRTKTFEILNFYKKVNNKKQIPYAGFANEGRVGALQYISRFIRGNFFIPDARKGWNKYALAKATEIIERENIEYLVTTSPPHSTQLIGLQLRQRFKLKWIADLRDPWTDIYYYHKMNHTLIAKSIDKNYERKVIETADGLVVVSDFIKKQFTTKTLLNVGNKFMILPNGYDEKNFQTGIKNDSIKNDNFVISYNGTIAADYPINVFIDACKMLFENNIDTKIKIQFTGRADAQTQKKLREAFVEKVQFTNHVTHAKSIEILLESNLLLLIIPEVKDNEGILTGKLFEYLAAQKTVLCIGPVNGNAAEIIKECNAGITINNSSVTEAYNLIDSEYSHWQNGTKSNFCNDDKYKKYARKSQAVIFENWLVNV